MMSHSLNKYSLSTFSVVNPEPKTTEGVGGIEMISLTLKQLKAAILKTIEP